MSWVKAGEPSHKPGVGLLYQLTASFAPGPRLAGFALLWRWRAPRLLQDRANSGKTSYFALSVGLLFCWPGFNQRWDPLLQPFSSFFSSFFFPSS
jgi:hypothetical protein